MKPNRLAGLYGPIKSNTIIDSLMLALAEEYTAAFAKNNNKYLLLGKHATSPSESNQKTN